MEQIGLMERFADPNLITSLSSADKFVGSLVTTVMGMGATFVILIIIWFVISIISRIINSSQNNKKQADTAVAEPVKTQPSAIVAETRRKNYKERN